jgi:hypothetical protein
MMLKRLLKGRNEVTTTRISNPDGAETCFILYCGLHCYAANNWSAKQQTMRRHVNCKGLASRPL